MKFWIVLQKKRLKKVKNKFSIYLRREKKSNINILFLISQK